jgi:hypothetical protein
MRPVASISQRGSGIAPSAPVEKAYIGGGNVKLAAQLCGEPVVLRRVTPLAERTQAARHGSHAGYRER